MKRHKLDALQKMLVINQEGVLSLIFIIKFISFNNYFTNHFTIVSR
jgi:hypothetical protein